MEILFALTLGSMVIFNGTLILYYFGNAYILPHFFPQIPGIGFGQSMMIVILCLFLLLVIFGNRIRQKKKNTKPLPKQNPATLRFGERAK